MSIAGRDQLYTAQERYEGFLRTRPPSSRNDQFCTQKNFLNRLQAYFQRQQKPWALGLIDIEDNSVGSFGRVTPRSHKDVSRNFNRIPHSVVERLGWYVYTYVNKSVLSDRMSKKILSIAGLLARGGDMAEMVALNFYKDTGNKLRFDAYVEEAVFELYIPKRRIPKPWPYSILVSVEPYQEGMILPHFSGDTSQPIDTIVYWCSDHTKTAHYYPAGEEDALEIGEPYIPYDLIPGTPKKVRIRVVWDKECACS